MSKKTSKKHQHSSSKLALALRQPLLWLVVLALGLTLCTTGVAYAGYQAILVPFYTAPQVSSVLQTPAPHPVQISVPQVGVNIPIISAQITNGQWLIPATTAAHLVGSANPGEPNNIVIYAHNKNTLFGPLKQAKVGDSITLTSATGIKYEYVIKEQKVVQPNQVDIIHPTDHEVLTVYTCTGLFDTQRLVLRAYPLKNTQQAAITPS